MQIECALIFLKEKVEKIGKEIIDHNFLLNCKNLFTQKNYLFFTSGKFEIGCIRKIENISKINCVKNT